MNPCPYCGGEVSDTAKACGHCGRWLPAEPTASPPTQPAPPPARPAEAWPEMRSPALAALREMPWTTLLVITAGWAIAFAVGATLLGLGVAYGFWFMTGAGVGAIGGLITGLAVRQTSPSFQWKQLLMVIGGWAIGALIGWFGFLSWVWLIPSLVGWLVGGLATGLALREAESHLQWKPLLVIATGWAIAPLATLPMRYLLALRGTLDALASGAIVGAVGGGVMLWVLNLERRKA
jgi:hypothetical protein